MAITAKFAADFTSFFTAVQKAEVELKSLDSGAGAVAKSLDRMVNSFTGQKVIKDATLMAEAVQRIGGAANLTENEQAKVNKTVTEAIEKYKALGQVAPKALTDMAAATAKAEKPMSTLNTTIKQVGTTLLAAFSIRAISGAVTSFTEFTGKITDLSAKTGISTTELQKLKYAAELSGGSLDGVTTAIGKMAKNLVEGDSSAVEAMKRLGLNINDIRQQEPGKAFATIADAIGQIPNPMERSTIAMQLFGKSGAELLPMITGGMTDAMQAAERLGIVMDEETVAAGDRLGDTFTTLQAVGQGVIGKVLTPMLPAIQLVADAMTKMGDVVTWLQNLFTSFVTHVIKAIKGLLDTVVAVTEFTASLPLLGRALGESDKAALASAKTWSIWLDDMAKGMDVVVPKATKATGNLKTAVGLLTDEQKQGAKASKEHAQAIAQEAKEVVASYAALVKGLQDYNKANMEAQQEAQRTGVKVADFGKVVETNHATMLAWLGAIGKGVPIIKGLGDELKKMGDVVDVSFKPLPTTFEELRDKADMFANSLKRLGQATGGIFGGLISSAGSVIGAFGDMADATDKFRRLAKTSFSQVAAYSIDMASSLVGVTQTAIGIIEGLYDSLTGKEKQAALNARGGLHQLQTDAALAGTAFNDTTEKAAGFRREMERLDLAIAESTARMERYGLTWRDLRDDLRQVQIDQFARTLIVDFRALKAVMGDSGKAVSAMGGAISELIVNAVKAGSKIPAALKPIIQQLIRMGGLTEDAARAMLGLAEDTMPSLADITDAAERYGLTLDQLGGKVQQLRLTETADQIVKDFNTLIEAGADVGVVMLAMKDKVQGLVTNALTLGLSLPESMRPLIEAMIKAGLLTDEFGDVLMDTSRLEFAKPLSERFDELLEKLDDLIDAFSKVGTAAEEGFGRARGAAERLGTAIPRGSGGTGGETAPGDPTPPNRNNPRQGAPGPGGDDVSAMAASISRVPILSASAGMGTPIVIVTKTYLDGKEVAESVVPHLTDVVQSYGAS